MITNNKDSQLILYLPDIVGGGYSKYWRNRLRYVAIKGGRASKKSLTTALRYIHNLMKYPGANLLVVRRYFITHQDSTLAALLWAIKKYKVEHLWKMSKAPLRLTYLPTGQQIIFRGLDKPDSITSITVSVGYLCWVWIEEAYQIEDEQTFNKLDLSIRGKLPDYLWHEIVCIFNPWDEAHWLKARFFDEPQDNVLSMTTNYLNNEFLSEQDILIYEKMKEKYPKRYGVEGLGNWGIIEGQIFTDVQVKEFDISRLKYLKMPEHYGLDFGFTNPTAFVALFVDSVRFIIYVFDEIYKAQLTNQQLAIEIRSKGYAQKRIVADSAEPKSIQELKNAGIPRVVPSLKGADSVRAGIQRLQDYTIIVHPSCENTIISLNNYVYTKNSKPCEEYKHIPDALNYATEKIHSKSIEVK